jgi:hypothetical protein
LWRWPAALLRHCCGDAQQHNTSWCCYNAVAAMPGNATGRGAAAMADSALQPWPTLCCNVFCFFCFLFLARQVQERKAERQNEKGRESL